MSSSQQSDALPFSLAPKNILVTGASSGIGRGIAVECAKMGAKVCITGRNAERLHDTLAQLDGDGHTAIAGDLTNEHDREAIATSVEALDGVVHSAGATLSVPCKMIELEHVRKMMDTNFGSTVLLQAELMRGKKVSKGASVVFISSLGARVPAVGNALYSASKAAIIAYASVLALELAPRKTRVNCICPATVWTPLLDATPLSKEEHEERERAYPLGRYGRPEDVAYMAAYLLSDASEWVTGSTFDITGGARI